MLNCLVRGMCRWSKQRLKRGLDGKEYLNSIDRVRSWNQSLEWGHFRVFCKVRKSEGLLGAPVLKGWASIKVKKTGQKQKRLVPLKQKGKRISEIMDISAGWML